MGIASSAGVIYDFAGPFYVSEDNMAFGRPTKFWQLSPASVRSSEYTWDSAVLEASQEYSKRVHNLCCDNCHSHVARALNNMRYRGSVGWDMVSLCLLMAWHGRYVNIGGFLRTWLPFSIIAAIVITVSVYNSGAE